MVVAEPLRPRREFSGQTGAALAGERQHLVPGVSVLVLQTPQHSQRGPCAVSGVVYGAQGVLRRIARTHAPTGSRLVGRNEARPEKRGATLDGIPHVQHGIDDRIRRVDGEAAQIVVPVPAQVRERCDHILGIAKARHLRRDARRLVGHAHDKDDFLFLSGAQGQVVAQRSDVVAPRGLDVAGLAPLDHLGVRQIPPATDENLPIGIEAGRLDAGSKEVGGRREARLRGDDAVFDPRFEDVLAPVEVELIVERIAEAEFNVGKCP